MSIGNTGSNILRIDQILIYYQDRKRLFVKATLLDTTTTTLPIGIQDPVLGEGFQRIRIATSSFRLLGLLLISPRQLYLVPVEVTATAGGLKLAAEPSTATKFIWCRYTVQQLQAERM